MRSFGLSRLGVPLILGVVTGLTGVSFLTETYSSPAFTGPFDLLNPMPWLAAQCWWGLAYVVAGLALIVPDKRRIGLWVRAGALLLGSAIWGIFGVASAIDTLAGPHADTTGSARAVTCLGMVLLYGLACRTLIADWSIDTRPRTRKARPSSRA